MDFTEATFAKNLGRMEEDEEDTQKLPTVKPSLPGEIRPDHSLQVPVTPRKNTMPARRSPFESIPQTPRTFKKHTLSRTHALDDVNSQAAVHALNGATMAELEQQTPRPLDVAQGETQIFPVPQPKRDQQSANMVEVTASSETQPLPVITGRTLLSEVPTTPLPTTLPGPSPVRHQSKLTRGRALLLAILLIIIVLNASMTGFGQVFGPHGWASILGNGGNSGPNLLKQIGLQLGKHGLTPGTKGQNTPEQIVNALLAKMTLDQKLGQMLMVRFNGTNYGSALNAMITQYHVGSVIEYSPTNIANTSQLSELNKQIQQGADLPMIISIDQEGGDVDRLQKLDGSQPSAATIGATNNPNTAYQQGLKDARDLARYGFNLNLAPVVDVTNVYNQQLAGRTYGKNPAIVSEMTTAYLKGLQQGGKVLGTLKHFPGLGDTSTDPHTGLPYLTRSLANLNAIDWAPYQKLLAQKNVYAIMVTHELVTALDSNLPSSLSPKVVDILRHQLGFQGVIITDGLTMGALEARYTLGQSAVLAIEAGDDLMMDPGSPAEVAQMVESIKQAMSSGAISQQRIDDSVRRILLLKYQMGLLNIHA